MHIVVYGKNGQLAKAYYKLIRSLQAQLPHITVEYFGSADCNLGQPNQLLELLNQAKPDLIINTAAYTSVDAAESEVDLAFNINALAPEIMAHYAVNHGITFLHYSTDYVFDGENRDFYIETDLPRPLNIYGKSKAKGELLIEKTFNGAISGQYVIFRTSWLYGEGKNFIKKILDLGFQQDHLSVVCDQFGVPTSADWLAVVSMDLVLDRFGLLKKIDSGIYHATPTGDTNRYALASYTLKIAKQAGAMLRLSEDVIKPILTNEYPAIAQRPMNSKMSSKKLKQAFVKQDDMSKLQYWKQSWADQVKTYVEELIRSNYLKGE